MSVNLPLGLLLQPDLPVWLGRALAGRPAAPAPDGAGNDRDDRGQDRSALRRALLRLRRAGYRVLLDDLVLEDGRWLPALPFAAFKLDRQPGGGAARRCPCPAGGAPPDAAGHASAAKLVIAEGVADAADLGRCCALGVHRAQGFSLAGHCRATLAAWSAGWRGFRHG